MLEIFVCNHEVAMSLLCSVDADDHETYHEVLTFAAKQYMYVQVLTPSGEQIEMNIRPKDATVH